jgi:hypothetical protein
MSAISWMFIDDRRPIFFAINTRCPVFGAWGYWMVIGVTGGRGCGEVKEGANGRGTLATALTPTQALQPHKNQSRHRTPEHPFIPT